VRRLWLVLGRAPSSVKAALLSGLSVAGLEWNEPYRVVRNSVLCWSLRVYFVFSSVNGDFLCVYSAKEQFFKDV